MTPLRIQLSRTAGWRMPPHTVKCDRSGKWGNPYRLDDMHASWSRIADPRARASACIAHYRSMAERGFVTVSYTARTAQERGDRFDSFGAHRVTEVAAKYLGGWSLGCWCGLCERHKAGKPLGEACEDCDPCHVDVLGGWANPVGGG